MTSHDADKRGSLEIVDLVFIQFLLVWHTGWKSIYFPNEVNISVNGFQYMFCVGIVDCAVIADYIPVYVKICDQYIGWDDSEDVHHDPFWDMSLSEFPYRMAEDSHLRP